MTWLRRNQHRIKAYLWLVLLIPTIIWWKESVLWVAFLSLYANYASEIAADEAHRGREDLENHE